MRNPLRSNARKAAYLRELAALGYHCAGAARLLGLFRTEAGKIGRLYRIDFPMWKTTHGTARQRAVRAAYAAGEPVRSIAERLGTSELTIRVMAHRLGVTARSGGDRHAHARGFAVPDHLRQKYRELRRLGLTAPEAGVELGLVPRGWISPKGEKA